MSRPKPRRTGYSATYRMKLEQEFLGEHGKNAMHRAPLVLRAAISSMMREIENLRASSSEALEKDAARYRWLRERVDEYPEGWYLDVHIGGAPSLETFEQCLDAIVGCSAAEGKS